MKRVLLVLSVLALVAIAIPGILWARLDENPVQLADNKDTEQLFSVNTLREITPGGSASGALSKYTLGKIGYDVSGDNIVWNQAKNGSDADVMLYNAAEKHLDSITTDTAEQVSPRIDGNKVVWMENIKPNVGGESFVASDLWVYDIATKKKTKVVENRNMQPYPDVQGDKVVWSEWNGSQWDIHLYKLSPASGESAESQITDSQYKKLYPRIDGNKVAWQENRNQNYDVFQYDISAGTTDQLTENTSNQTKPVPAGSKTFWTDSRYSPAKVAYLDNSKNQYYYMAQETTGSAYDFNLGSATDNGVAAIQSTANGSYSDVNICFYDFRIGGWHAINKSGPVRSVPEAVGLTPEADGKTIVWAEVASDTPGTIRMKMATIAPTNYARDELVFAGVGATRLGKNFSPMAIGFKNSIMVGEREDVLSSDNFSYLNYFEDNVSWRDYRGQPSDAVVEDINGDGLKDMLLLSQSGAGDAVGNYYAISLIVYEQDSYPNQKLYRKGAYSTSGSVMAVGDINGDGLKDVVTRDASGVYVLLHKADGGFDRLPTRYSLPTSGTVSRGSIALADVNGDGINDVLTTAKTTTNGVVYVLTSSKEGKLAAAKAYSTLGNDPRAMALVDLNGDSTKELVVANYASASMGILSIKNGALSSDSTVTASTNPEEVKVADVVPSSSVDYIESKPEVFVLDKKNKRLQVYNPTAGSLSPWFTLPVRTSADLSFAVGDVYEDANAVWQGTTTEFGQTLGKFTERYQDVILSYGDKSLVDTYSFKNYVAPGAAVNPASDYVCVTKKVNETMTKSIIAAGDVGMYGERTGHGALKYDHGQSPNTAYTCTGTCHTHPQNGSCSGDCHKRKGSVTGFTSVSFSGPAKQSVEETSTDVSYSGVWTSSSGKFSGGTAKYTSRAGDSLTLTFTGTGVTWYSYIASTVKTPNRADVYIDADPTPTTVDLASFTPGYNVPVFTKENLDDGIHTITIKAKDGGTSGPYVWVDAFDILRKNVSFSIADVGFDISEDTPDTYKICLKCHSVYRNGGASPLHNGQANVMEQFNPKNASFHPLLQAGKNTSIQQGTFATQSMNATSRVDCDDCHTIGAATVFLTWNSDRPLGSQTPSGFTPYLTSLPFIGSTVSQTDYLCYKCHSYGVYYNGNAGSDFAAHKRHIKELGISCEACHDVHGSTTNSRLLKNNIGVDETAPGEGTCSGAPNCHGQRYSY